MHINSEVLNELCGQNAEFLMHRASQRLVTGERVCVCACACVLV